MHAQAEMIFLTLPDGSRREFPAGTTVLDAAGEILGSSKRKNKVLGALLDGELTDFRIPITQDASFDILMDGREEALDILRHSAAHIMAEATLRLFPNVKFGIGPATQDGFYYDFKVDTPFSPEDLQNIEREMNKIIRLNLPFERKVISREDAIEMFRSRGETFKVELLQDLEDEIITTYQQGDFIDLCRGPHVRHSGQVKVVKLLSNASAYWRGDETNDVLQRIYGTAFFTEDALTEYLELQEKIKERDHRRLGKKLELFSVHDEVGAGLIFWHPNGAMVRHLVEEFWRAEHLRRGYDFVYTPHIARERIYEISGHLENYSENMYAPLVIDEQPYRLKPMNCPGHIKIYQTRLHSYRDLPIRYCELGTVYRYERSGTLHGMLRVRGFTQDDAHVFCTPAQLSDEVYAIIDLVHTLMTAFGYTYKIFLATRPEKYLGTDDEWEMATQSLKIALERWGQPYQIDEGGGVFYAPKIDIKLKDALGREWQGPTIQVDLNLPKRFGVTYIGEDNSEHEAIMIHRAVLGSMERFVGGLIEHFGGAFPMWLAPTQIAVLPITDKHHVYADTVDRALKKAGLRTRLDLRSEKLGFKIREAQENKLPYMLIIGEREALDGTVSVRHRIQGDVGSMSIDAFIDRAMTDVAEKVMNE